ncbi:MAG: transporter [Betaproteobacteria bacterium]
MQTTPTKTYGADQHGLICGFAFSVDGIGQAIGADLALQWLADPVQAQGFVWLHFNLSQVSTEKWLRQHLNLSAVFYETLREASRSTRVELDDGTLVAVVNDVHYDFSFEPSDISTLWLSVSEKLIVTARMQPLRSVDRLRDAVRRGVPITSSVALLVHLMHDQGDVLANIVREITTRIDTIEDKLLAGRLETKRADLGVSRRLLVRLQRLLAPEPAALFRLLKKPPAWISEADIEDLHQSSEEFNVALSDMAALQERIKLLQEEIAGRVAEANNRSLFVLTVVTVLALPINIIAGLLGMNVGGIPLADHPGGFWIVVAVIVSFTAVAAWIVFRKDRD